jgi:nucleotide-binding universal stress UspA family protein
VLVGIDFSEGSLGAVREAQWLAHRTGLDLQVLHVTESEDPWRPDAPAQDWLRAVPVDPKALLVRQGQPWVEIVRHAHEVSAAVIVVGSHGASGPQAITLGSTASKVALRSPCPVLFVARRAERRPTDEWAASSFHP